MAYNGMMRPRIDEEDQVVDIPTMAAMGGTEYSAYMHDHLLYMDHHEVLRTNIGDYPLATSREQIDALIEVLQRYKSRMP